MIDGSWHTDSTSPYQIFIYTIILGSNTISHWQDCEALLKEEQTNRLHHCYCIYLGIKQRLLPPHASDEQFFFLKEQRKDTIQYMNCSFTFGNQLFILQHLILHSTIVHYFYCMRHDMYNVICFAFFDRPEVFQEDGGEDIREIVRGKQELIEVGCML